jgi:hypothetical protein
MTAEEAIRQFLGESESVSALVDDRIYPGEIPDDDTPSPWIFYFLSEERPDAKLASNDWGSATARVEGFAETYSEARELKEAVKTALNARLVGGLYKCLWKDATTEPVDGGFNVTLDFELYKTRIGVVVSSGTPLVSGNSFILVG